MHYLLRHHLNQHLILVKQSSTFLHSQVHQTLTKKENPEAQKKNTEIVRDTVVPQHIDADLDLLEDVVDRGHLKEEDLALLIVMNDVLNK